MDVEPILLKNCRLVVQGVDRIVENVSLYIEGNRVTYVGDKPPLGSRSGIVLDCSSYIAMPCLYNAHTHAAMTLLRGYHDDSELHDWLTYMWGVENNLSPSIVYKASRLAIMEMLSTGTCGFMDMYFYPEETAKAAQELGIRARLGPVLMGDIDPYKAIEEAKRFAKRLKGDRLVGGAINVHSIYATPLDAIRLAAEASRELEVPMHIHVSETRREVYEAKKKYGLFPVELLARKLNALHRYVVLVHAGWISSWELNLVREANASIVHCPTSNMKLATAGHFPTYEAINMGINVALGTDGPASNNSLDMFLEMKIMVLLQRHSYWDIRIVAKHALQAATTGSARALAIPSKGGIEVNSLADLILIDAKSLYIQPLRSDNLLSAIVYAATGRDVAYTIIDGRIVYSKAEDLAKWRDEAFRISRDLNRFIDSLKDVKAEKPPCSPMSACKAQ